MPALAHAVTPAELLREDLEPEAVQVMSLRDGMLRYFDSDRTLQTLATSEIVQVRAMGGDAARRADDPHAGLLTLTDGQRLIGTWAGANEAGDAVVWAHPQLGSMTVPIERLRWLRLPTQGDAGDAVAAPAPAIGALPEAQDVVLLVNGDEVRGYLVTVGAVGLSILPTDAEQPVDLPLDRVRAVSLANPSAEAEGGADVLALHDGSRLQGRGLRITQGQVHFELALNEQATATLALEQVRSMAFAGEGPRLVELLALPWTVSGGGEAFGVSMRPYAAGEGLWLHAPVVLEFELPEGARRVTVTAELPSGPDVPGNLAAWADFELILHHADGEAARQRLHGGQPRVRLNTLITGPTLRLELDAGVNGPVLDQLHLTEALLLVE